MALYTELFNSSITRVGHIGEDNPRRGLATTVFNLRADGTAQQGAVPIHSRYVVVDNRIRVRGVRIRSRSPRMSERTPSPPATHLCCGAPTAPSVCVATTADGDELGVRVASRGLVRFVAS